jgi:hypothetical protein
MSKIISGVVEREMNLFYTNLVGNLNFNYENK